MRGNALVFSCVVLTAAAVPGAVYRGRVVQEWGTPVDVFSFAIIFNEVVGKRGAEWSWADVVELCEEDTTQEKHEKLKDAIKAGAVPTIESHITDADRDIIERCWAFAPDDRPSFQEVWQYLTPDHP